MSELKVNNLGNELNTQRTIRFDSGTYWIEVSLHSSMHYVSDYQKPKNEEGGVCKKIMKKYARVSIKYRPAFWTLKGFVPCNSGFHCQCCSENYEDKFKRNSPCRAGNFVGNYGVRYNKNEIIEYLREKGFLKPLPIYKAHYEITNNK